MGDKKVASRVEQIKPFPLSHPAGAAEKVRQLTRIRTRKLRIEYTINTDEAEVQHKGKTIAILKKEKLLGLQPKEIWVAYDLAGKRKGSVELHKIKDLLKQLAKKV
jgi:hypothetical protein